MQPRQSDAMRRPHAETRQRLEAFSSYPLPCGLGVTHWRVIFVLALQAAPRRMQMPVSARATHAHTHARTHTHVHTHTHTHNLDGWDAPTRGKAHLEAAPNA